MLELETPASISPKLWPPNSPDPDPVDYKIWGVLQERVYRVRIHDVDHLKRHACLRSGHSLIRQLSMTQSSSGASVFVPVFALREDILSI